MKKDEYGVFSVVVPANADGSVAIPHGSKVKVSETPQPIHIRELSLTAFGQISLVMPNSGERVDRLPAWSKRVVQDLNVNPNYEAVFWNPAKQYVFKNKQPPKPKSLRVYEAHGKEKAPPANKHYWDCY